MSGQGDEPRRGVWAGFRRWPGWAQAISWVLLPSIVLSVWVWSRREWRAWVRVAAIAFTGLVTLAAIGAIGGSGKQSPASSSAAGAPAGLSTSTPAATTTSAEKKKAVHHRSRVVHRVKKPKRRHRQRHSIPKGVPAVDVPNAVLTPGAAFAVGTAQICQSGYASSVRDVPDSEKEAVYARYGVPHVPYQHEVDHLVSLEIGGSNVITNLWPEPYAGRWGARTKDVLENKLHDLVCSGELALRSAQHIEATNWVGAYKRYIGETPSAPSAGSGGGGSSSGGGGGSSSDCTPGYTPCLVDHNGEDYDCYGGGGNGPYFTARGVTYTVTGTDPYDLDGNHDGKACG